MIEFPTKKIVILVLTIIVVCTFGCSSSNENGQNSQIETQRMEEMSMNAVKVLEKYAIDPEGLTELKEDVTDQHAYYMFAIDSEDGLIEQINSTFGSPVSNEKNQLPRYDKGFLARQLHSEESITGWTRLIQGDGEAKTKAIDLYITTSADGEKHLYIFE